MANVEENLNLLSRKIVTRVSFALNLIDSFSLKRPIGDLELSIKGSEPKIVKNPSGFYLFLNMPHNSYHVTVKSQFYFDKEVLVEMSALDPKNPVKNVTLNPLPSYPFPPGTTLIRGMVYDGGGNPASGAEVKIAVKSMNAKTTEKGEFVFYFKNLTQNDIKKENGKRYLKGSPGTTLTVNAQKGLETGEGKLADVEECTATSLKDPIELS